MSEVDLPDVEENIRFLDGTNNQEILHDLFRVNFEFPVAFVRAERLRRVLENHFEFLPAQDNSLLSEALKENIIRNVSVLRELVFLNFSPLKLVPCRRGVDNVELARILHLRAKTLKFNYIEGRV